MSYFQTIDLHQVNANLKREGKLYMMMKKILKKPKFNLRIGLNQGK